MIYKFCFIFITGGARHDKMFAKIVALDKFATVTMLVIVDPRSTLEVTVRAFLASTGVSGVAGTRKRACIVDTGGAGIAIISTSGAFVDVATISAEETGFAFAFVVVVGSNAVGISRTMLFA